MTLQLKMKREPIAAVMDDENDRNVEQDEAHSELGRDIMRRGK